MPNLKSFYDHFKPQDVIAIIVLVACFVLIAMGIDSFLSATVALIVGYYFGRRVDQVEIKTSS